MYGKIIDRAMLTVLAAAAHYLLFLGVGFGIPASAALSFMCLSLERHALRRLPRRYRCTAVQAEAAVAAIARMSDEEAIAALRILLADRIGDGDTLVPLLRLPEGQVSTGDLFAAWRTHRAAARVCVAATCPATPNARRFARTQHCPELLLMDSRDLSRSVRRTGLYVPPDAPRLSPLCRLSRASHRLAGHPLGLRALLYGLGMWGFYLISGSPLYLFAAVTVLFAFGASHIMVS